MSMIPPPVGRIIIPPVTAYSSILLVADTIYFAPLVKYERNIFVDQVGCRLTNAGTGSPLFNRMGVYRSRNGLPGELLYDSGPIANVVGANVSQMNGQLPYTLKENLWTCITTQSGSTTACSVSAYTVTGLGDIALMLGHASFLALPNTLANTPTGLTAAYPFGALPPDASVLTFNYSLNAIHPVVGLRRSQ